MADDETIEEVRRNLELMYAAGYETPDEIRERALASMSGLIDDDEGGDDELERVVDTAMNDLSARTALEQEDWPEHTDCDRLDSALLALGEQGIASCGYQGWDQDEAAHITREFISAAQSTGTTVRGYVYFTEQDVERAIEDGELLLAFGRVASPEITMEPDTQIGREAVAALRKAGLSVSWDHDASCRILVSLHWQRRLGSSHGSQSLLMA